MSDPTCACDSRYDGCDHASPCGGLNDGTGRGPWCAECQPRRLDSIRASLANLRADFAGGRGYVH